MAFCLARKKNRRSPRPSQKTLQPPEVAPGELKGGRRFWPGQRELQTGGASALPSEDTIQQS